MLHPSSTAQISEIDQNTALCLACSCSLPPLRKSPSHPSTSTALPQIFLTPCCRRPICPGCTAANPRLQRYDPCLACLGGVGVLRSGSGTSAQQVREKDSWVNIDGAVRDEDTFVLGDVDDDEENDESFGPSRSGIISQPEFLHALPIREGPGDPEQATNDATPSNYYISRNDTLQGIALRYGLNGHELCRLNNLPPSTLRTTPHLLHTRRYLILPPSARQVSGLHPNKNADETFTKEVDWHIAKAYVALADDAEETDEYNRKHKEGGLPDNGSSSLEERAIGRYLDDEEWEANARKDGGKVGVAGLPFVNGWGNSQDDRPVRTEKEVHGRRWWQR